MADIPRETPDPRDRPQETPPPGVPRPMDSSSFINANAGRVPEHGALSGGGRSGGANGLTVDPRRAGHVARQSEGLPICVPPANMSIREVSGPMLVARMVREPALVARMVREPALVARMVREPTL